MEDNYKRAQTS